MFNRRANIETPYQTTCQWIFDLASYQVWVSSTSGLLWIKGKPGSGKSTLMAHLYHTGRLRNSSSAGPMIFLEFFFTTRGTPMQRSPLGMFRSLINQLYSSNTDARLPLKGTYSEKQASFGHGPRAWEWQQPELEKLLLDMILAATSAKQGPLVILIDALDEAGEEAAQHMACYFHDLNDQLLQQSAAAKICISCRHYPVLPRFQAIEIWVDHYNHDDIAAYINNRLHTEDLLPATVETYDDEEWRALVQSLVDTARGVFQWVRLVVPQVRTAILRGDSPARIRKWLARVPSGLSQMYRYIFEQLLAGEHSTQSRRLFQWVCLATFPLTVTEVRYALATHDTLNESSSFLPCHHTENFIGSDENMKRCIRSWSGGLIEVMEMADDGHDTLQPIHQSVNDFCLHEGLFLLAQMEPRSQNLPLASTSSSESSRISSCYGELYRCCLTYISQDAAKFRYSYWRGAKTVNTEFPFLAYAISSCLLYAEKARDDRSLEIAKEAEMLRLVTDIWRHCMFVFPNQFYVRKISREFFATSLHFAAAANLIDLTIYLLKSGSDVNAVEISGETALHVAAKLGHLAVSKTLVEHAANIQQATADGTTPLLLAAAQGHFELFSWLESQGANLTATEKSSKTVLYAAAECGSIAITEFCIRKRVNLDAHGGKRGTALNVACAAGHEKIVQILLRAGADINTPWSDGSNALWYAATGGHERVLKILLDAGANPNVGEDPFNALQTASADGREKMIRMLLNAGADVNRSGGYALYGASVNGHEGAVQILLEAGADANARGGDFNALQAASAYNHEEIVRKLIEAGANVNAPGEYGTALYTASTGGHERVVRMLLAAGADVNMECRNGTAVYAASMGNHKTVRQILVEAGADVDGEEDWFDLSD